MTTPNPFIVTDWREKVTFGEEGPAPTLLVEDELQKVVLGTVKAGQSIPLHADRGGTFVFLDGTGTFHAGDQQLQAQPGMIVHLAENTVRGVDAETDMVFLAIRAA